MTMFERFTDDARAADMCCSGCSAPPATTIWRWRGLANAKVDIDAPRTTATLLIQADAA